MNRERVQESIERVRAGSSNDSTYDVAAAFMGDEQWSVADYRNALVELLETARDSVPLPKDADGEALRLGDLVSYKDDKEVLSVRYIHLGTDHDGQASRPVWMIGDLVRYRDDEKALSVRYTLGVGRDEDYWAATPSALVHHHKPTVEAMLREFWVDADAVVNEDEFDGIVDKYATEIREVMQA